MTEEEQAVLVRRGGRLQTDEVDIHVIEEIVAGLPRRTAHVAYKE
jgi:hypothetical protein